MLYFRSTLSSPALHFRNPDSVAREERIELPPTVLETAILPLNYSRKVGRIAEFVTLVASSSLAPMFEFYL